MLHKLSVKRMQKYSVLFMLAFLLVCTIIPPVVNTYALSSKDVVQKSYKKFAGNSSKDQKFENVIGKINQTGTGGSRDNFPYVFGRLFVPGYMNEVSDYVPPKNADKSMITDVGDKSYLCNRNHPQNLVSYNCDLPNISAQLLQAVVGSLSTNGVAGNQRQGAQPTFGLGVPNGIPGKTVPIEGQTRPYKYTGLELFGYNLNTTTYSGEWDQIIPSTKARLLSNYGTLDKIKVAGASIYHGVSSGLAAYVNNVDILNPISWFTAVGAAWNAGSSASLNTILDTSDANVAITNGWVRPNSQIASSFYNVYTLTDKQVIDTGLKQTAKIMAKLVLQMTQNDPTFAPYRALATEPTGFTEKTGKHQPSREEQFKKWLKGNSKATLAREKGLDYGNPSNESELKKNWAKGYQSLMENVMNDATKNSIVMNFFKKSINQAVQKNPYYNPQEPISHYVCTKADGQTPQGDPDSGYKYLYKKYNHKSTEYLTAGCPVTRPTIGGGLFGDGYLDGKGITDTRNVSHFHTSLLNTILSSLPIVSLGGSIITWLSTGVTKGIAIITNEMLNLSFSPLMKQLGVTTLVKAAMKNFAQSIFWPLLLFVIGYAALAMFIEVIRTQSARRFFTSFLTMCLVFVVSVVIFAKPDTTISFIEEVPLQVDNGIANILLSQNDNSTGDSSNADTNICAASGSQAGIRSAQCFVWKNLIFNTWTYEQFGTGYNNLYASGTSGLQNNDDTLRNTNGNLVGNAQVDLGGGNIIHNWALYQYSLLTSGTINNSDTNHPIGSTSNNIYRLVDAQAGPKNGQGTDSRYLGNWSGTTGIRGWVAFLASILAILSAIAIWGFLITKIELTFLTAVMFIGLPIMLLFGLTPRGSVKLKGYAWTLLGLYAKRELMVLLLCTMLKVWDGSVSNSNTSYTNVFIGSATIILFFIIYKPHLARLLHFDSEDLFAGSGLLSGDADSVRDFYKQHMPLTLQHKFARGAEAARGAAQGVVGGFLAGRKYGKKINEIDKKLGIHVSKKQQNARIREYTREGIKKGAIEGASFLKRKENNKITRMGLSSIEEIGAARRAVDEEAVNRFARGQTHASRIYRQAILNSRYGETASDINKVDEFSNLEWSQVAKNARTLRKLDKGYRDAQKLIDKAQAGEGILTPLAGQSSRLQHISDRVDKAVESSLKQENKFLHPIKARKNEEHAEELRSRDRTQVKVDKTAQEHIETLEKDYQAKHNPNNDKSQNEDIKSEEIKQQDNDTSNETKEREIDKKTGLPKQDFSTLRDTLNVDIDYHNIMQKRDDDIKKTKEKFKNEHPENINDSDIQAKSEPMENNETQEHEKQRNRLKNILKDDNTDNKGDDK